MILTDFRPIPNHIEFSILVKVCSCYTATRAQRGCLSPGARSEIGAPCHDFFPEDFQNGRPPKNPSFSKVNIPISSGMNYYLFWTSLWSLTNMYQTDGLLFFYQGDFSAPLRWRLGHMPPLCPPLATPLHRNCGVVWTDYTCNDLGQWLFILWFIASKYNGWALIGAWAAIRTNTGYINDAQSSYHCTADITPMGCDIENLNETVQIHLIRYIHTAQKTPIKYNNAFCFDNSVQLNKRTILPHSCYVVFVGTECFRSNLIRST